MLKLKGSSLLFDIFIVLLLVILVKYAHQLLHKPSHTPVPMESITQEIDCTQDAHAPNNVVQTARNQHRQHLSEKTRNLLATADLLLTKLHEARLTVDNDDMIESRDRDTYIADIKEITSHIEHIVQEFEQDPLHGQALLGPTGSSTRIVYERSLQQKLIQYAQETEKLFIRLYNELQGQHKPLDAAASLHVCVTHIKYLSAQLS